jgi:hypothetical protein
MLMNQMYVVSKCSGRRGRMPDSCAVRRERQHLMPPLRERRRKVQELTFDAFSSKRVTGGG